MLTLPTQASASTVERSGVLIWIDAETAVIVRWVDHEPSVERHVSDVPAHHRATGHVRYDPLTRHGGGGRQAADEHRRIEHLDRFVAEVAARLEGDDDLVVMGPGTVHERLGALLRELDSQQRRTRSIDVRTSGRRTDRQLVAQLRAHLGAGPKRRRVRG